MPHTALQAHFQLCRALSRRQLHPVGGRAALPSASCWPWAEAASQRPSSRPFHLYSWPQETADFLKIDGVHFLPLCTQSISSATTSNVHINYYHNASTSVCAALPGESVPAVTCILLPSRPCPWLRFPELLHAQQQSWDSPRGGEAAGRVCTQILSDPGSEVHLVHGFLLPSSLCPIEQQHPKSVWSPHAECPQL